MIQKVTEAKELIIGEFYIVPCIKAQYKIIGFRQGEWVPVIGNIHNDLEIGISDLHFHYDRRFAKKYIKPSSIITVRLKKENLFPTEETPIVWRRKKCVKTIDDSVYLAADSNFFEKLEANLKNNKMTCLTCPHKGLPLNAIPPLEDGGIVCPGHGLKWNHKTGELFSN